MMIAMNLQKILTRKRSGNHEKAERKKQGGRTPHIPKPEEQGGMPHLRHYPLAKHHKDRNLKYHEE
jgi:hypothetical protein